MGANSLEKFDMAVVKRDTIHGADYNPRKISAFAKKNLNKWLKSHGLWCPLTVNRRTMTLVSGHQRIDAMDTILRTQDYEITIAFVDVPELEEVAGNVFMNNPSAQGEWDILKLGDLGDAFPDLNFETDMGFEPADLDIMFGGLQERVEQEQAKETWQKENPLPAGVFNKERQRTREDGRKQDQCGEMSYLDKNDIQVTVVFNTNREKTQFMKDIHCQETEKYIKFSRVIDLYEHRHTLTVP